MVTLLKPAAQGGGDRDCRDDPPPCGGFKSHPPAGASPARLVCRTCRGCCPISRQVQPGAP